MCMSDWDDKEDKNWLESKERFTLVLMGANFVTFRLVQLSEVGK